MSLQRAVLPPSRADRDLAGAPEVAAAAVAPPLRRRAPDASMSLADAVHRPATEAEVLRDPARTAAEGLVQGFLAQFGRRLGAADRAYAAAQRERARVFGPDARAEEEGLLEQY